jgi:hypothetical protein
MEKSMMPTVASNLTSFVKRIRTPKLLKHPIKGAKRAIFWRGVKGLVMTRTGAAVGAAVAVPLAVIAVKGVARR